MFGYFDDPVTDRTHVETGSTEEIGGQDPPLEDEKSGRGGEPRRADYGCVGCDFMTGEM